MGKGKHIIAFIIMFSIIIGTVYMSPDIIAKAWNCQDTAASRANHPGGHSYSSKVSSSDSSCTWKCTNTNTTGTKTCNATTTYTHSGNSCSKCGWTKAVSTHTHKWSTEWSWKNDRHWHECVNANCPLASESNHKNYSGYGSCDYSSATCTQPLTCTVCGHTKGTPLGHNTKGACEYIDRNTHKAICGVCKKVISKSEPHNDDDGDGKCDGCGGDMPTTNGCSFSAGKCGCSSHPECEAYQYQSCNYQCWGAIVVNSIPDPTVDSEGIPYALDINMVNMTWNGCSGHTITSYNKGSMTFSFSVLSTCNWDIIVGGVASCATCSGHVILGSKSFESHNYVFGKHIYNGSYYWEPTENAGKHKQHKYCSRCDKYSSEVQTGSHYFVVKTEGTWKTVSTDADGTKHQKKVDRLQCTLCGHEKDEVETRDIPPDTTATPTPSPTPTPEPTPVIITTTPPPNTPTPTPITNTPTPTPPTDPPTNPVTPPVNRYHTVKVSNKDANQHIYTCDGQSCQLGGSCNATYPENHRWVNNGASTVTQRTDSYKATYHNINQPQKCDATLPTATIFSNYTYGYPYNASTIDQNKKYSFLMSTFGVLSGAYQQFYTSASSCNATHTDTSMQQHSFIRNNTAYKDDDNGNTSLDTTHSRTCSECGYPDKVAHTYSKTGSYEYYENGTGHSKKCTTCGHIYTTTHTFPATWTNDTSKGDHYRVCTGCGFVSRESHRYGSWTQGNTTEHTRTCLDCGHVDSEPHKYPSTWTRKDSSVHKHNCTVCGREETSPHDYPSTWTDKDAVNHSHICNQCTNEVTEPHHYPKYSGYDYQKVNATTHNKICDANGCKHTVSQAHNYIDIKQTEVTTDKVGYHKIIHTWKCGGNTTTGCGDTYETTEYVPYRYTVKFDANGGNAVADITYIIGNTGYKFPGCSRTDYVFKGWLLYSDSTQKTGSTVKILVSDTDPLSNGIANSKYIKKDTAMSYDGKTADGAVFTYIAIWEHKEPKAVENSKITAKSTVYEVSKVTETGYRGYYVKGTASGALVYLDGNFKYNSATWTPYKSIMLKTKGTATNAYIRPSTVIGWTIASGSTNSGDSILPTVKTTQVAGGKFPAYPYWVEFTAKSGMITVYQSATVTDKWSDGKVSRNKDITTDSTDYVTIISDGDAPTFVTSGGGSAKTELDNIDKKNWKTTKNYPITIVSTESNTTDSGFNAGKSYITIKNITKNIEYTLKKTPVTDANGKIIKYTFETFDMLNPNSLKTDLFNGEFDITWHLEDNVGNVTEGKKEYRITLTVDTLHSVTDNKDFSKADGITLKKGATGSYYVKTTGNVDKIVITYPTAWKISNKQVLNTYKGNIENISKTTELTSRTTNTITQTKNGTSPDDIIYQNNGSTSERQCFMTPIDIPKGKVTVTVTAYRGDAVKTDNLTVTILDEAVTDDVYSFITDVR